MRGTRRAERGLGLRVGHWRVWVRRGLVLDADSADRAAATTRTTPSARGRSWRSRHADGLHPRDGRRS
eukprot:3936213-Rhodomonas_salina.1